MTKRNFEDAIKTVLIDDTQKSALDFAAFLQTHEMSPNELDGNMWQVSHKDGGICYVYIDGAAQMPGPWTVWPDGDYTAEPEGFAIDKSIKELALAHINICGSCGGACSPGKAATVFGKEFDNISNYVLAFNNPKDEALECLKELIKWRITILSSSQK